MLNQELNNPDVRHQLLVERLQGGKQLVAAAQGRGVSVYLIGRTLSTGGGIATGGEAEISVGKYATDLCVLGACGLDLSFGPSADDSGEAGIKRMMVLASTAVTVVTDSVKFTRRVRQRVLEIDEIDSVVTDRRADSATVSAMRESNVGIHRV